MGSIVLAVMILTWVIVMTLLKRVSKNNNAAKRNGSGSRNWYTEKAPGAGFGKRAARSTDGHVLRGDQDITCRRFGHNHPRSVEPEMRYIVHDDPEEGYIILNGKKMLRTEATKYEDSI